MAPSSPERPRQVTAVAWTIVVASVLVVVTVFEYVAGLRSLESRERIAEVLAEPPGSDLGVSVSTAIEALRVLAFVAAACATAAAVLGFQVLQRSESARLALSVLAVPLFFAGMPSAGLLAAVVVAGVVMLWLQPARDWYAGRAPAARTPRPAAPPAQQTPPHPSAPPTAPEPTQPLHPPAAGPAGAFPPVGTGPSPYTGTFGQSGAPVPPQAYPPATPYPPTNPYQAQQPVNPYQYQQSTNPYQQPPRADRRPSAVVWACVLTWAFSTITAGMMLVLAVVLAVSPDDLLDELYASSPQLSDLPYSRGELTAGVLVMAVGLAAWALVAIALAALVFAGSGWARIALMISAVGASLLMLIMLWGAVLLVVPLAAAVATTAALQRAESRLWCTRRR